MKGRQYAGPRFVPRLSPGTSVAGSARPGGYDRGARTEPLVPDHVDVGLLGPEVVAERWKRSVLAVDGHRRRRDAGERERRCHGVLGRVVREDVVGDDIAVDIADALELSGDARVARAAPAGDVIAQQWLFELRDLGHHAAEILHVGGALRAPHARRLAGARQPVLAEAPPEQAPGALHDG